MNGELGMGAGAKVKMQGSAVAPISLVLAGLLVLLGAGWSLVQKGCAYYYEGEATSLFEKIEQGQVKYRNINNQILPFSFQDSQKAFQDLKIDPKEAKYYDFSVEQTDSQTFRITAQMKPETVKKWYIHSPGSNFRLIYEKKDGQKGRLIS